MPYAWGARLYVVGHTALAFAGMVALARSLGVSTVGAGIGGLSYAFGGPVLFQYCNVIYLVGAAWVPWGLRAAERLVRLRRPGPLVELAVVLAMQVHGGDPQAAYLTVVCGAGYAVVLARPRAPVRPVPAPVGWRLGLVAAWVVGVLAFARWRPAVPGWFGPVWVPALLVWTAAAIWLARRWRRGSDDRLGRRLAALAAAALLGAGAGGGAAVHGAWSSWPRAAGPASGCRRTGRSSASSRIASSSSSGRGPSAIPYPEHRSWIQLIPPEGDRDLWEPSLYVGGLALVLGPGCGGVPGGPPWRPWLTAVAAVGLLASFGKFASPLWWFRWFAVFASALGPHDPLVNAPRTDAYLLDMVGSPYELLAALLPGFGLFRYPAKLFTLTAVAVSALAGLGWDELVVRADRSGSRAAFCWGSWPAAWRWCWRRPCGAVPWRSCPPGA